MAISHRRNKRMLRRSRRKRRGLAETLLEIFAVPLMLFVMCDPDFELQDWNPPKFNAESTVNQQSSPKSNSCVLVIGADGKLTIDGNPTSLESLVGDLQRETGTNRRIRLVVEAAKDGVGNVNTYLQVQASLSNTELWSRTSIPHQTSGHIQSSSERSDQ